MAIRRYKLAIDNHPAAGYATIDDIQGSGEFFMELGWHPQAATVSLAKQYFTPAKFIPISDSKLYVLLQTAPGALSYNINTCTTVPAATDVSSLTYSSLFNWSISSRSNFINTNSWHLYSNISPTGADQAILYVNDFTAYMTLLLLSHPDDFIDGECIYSGFGSDVSVTYGLPALTKFELLSGVSSLSEIAEMVFIDGDQVTGDIYDYDYSYHTGAYFLSIESDVLYLQFYTPVSPAELAYFMVFRRQPEPELRVRYESDPFEDNGLWIVYNNLPKGTLIFNYFVR